METINYQTKTSRLPNQITQLVEKITTVLQNGGLVIMPTETIYGVMVDATNPAAVAKLLNYKSRRRGKPLSIAVADQKMAESYAVLNEQAQNIYRTFLPGPVTVFSALAGTMTSKNKKKPVLAPGIASEFNTIGIRIPDYQLVLEVVKKLGKPVSATSANQSGKKTPYSINDILSKISTKQKGLIDLIIDAGTLPKRPPSIVIDTTLSTPLVMRGEGLFGTKSPEKSSKVPNSPGAAIFITKSVEETQNLSGKLLLKHQNRLASKGLIIALDGELGAGKTTFTQGMAKFLRINDIVSSPTYTYQKEYSFDKDGLQGKLYHFDCWAVENRETLQLLEIQSFLTPGCLVVIEWWDQIKQLADFTPDLNIEIVPGQNEQERHIGVIENIW